MDQAPQPGTPEFLRMIERAKDRIERETGVRPDCLLDVSPEDADWLHRDREDEPG